MIEFFAGVARDLDLNGNAYRDRLRSSSNHYLLERGDTNEIDMHDSRMAISVGAIGCGLSEVINRVVISRLPENNLVRRSLRVGVIGGRVVSGLLIVGGILYGGLVMREQNDLLAEQRRRS